MARILEAPVEAVKSYGYFVWGIQRRLLNTYLARTSFLWTPALLLLVFISFAQGETWSRTSRNSLPDSAFASIEVTPDGKKVRHLPHHDRTGALDIPHLLSALSRLSQVKWVDPQNADAARRHLEEHYRHYREEKIAALKPKLPLNLNTATAKELAALPFIGPRRAQAIITEREKLGEFRSVEELKEIKGIGPTIFAAIKDLVTASHAEQGK